MADNVYSAHTDAELNTIMAAADKSFMEDKGRDWQRDMLFFEVAQRAMQFKEDFEGVTAGITAGTTQSQAGGTVLTTEINEVDTVGTALDAITLTTAVAGKRQFLANNGALRLQVFPSASDDLGAGANNSITLDPGENIMFYAFDATTWEVITERLPTITAGAGTGLTVNDPGKLGHGIYKVTLTFAGLSAAATTATATICTLPAKCKLVGMIADTTTKYIGGAVSAATIAVGIASGNVDAFIEEHDVFAAAVVSADLTNADLGSLLIAAATTPIQSGAVVWAATTAIQVSLVTTSADTDACTQGSTTYYIEYVQY